MQNRVAEIMSALTPQQKRAVHYRYIDISASARFPTS